MFLVHRHVSKLVGCLGARFDREDTMVQHLSDRILQQTMGIPNIVALTAIWLVENQSVEVIALSDHHHIRIACEDVSDIVFPEIDEMVQKRLKGLPEESQDAIKLASLMGLMFDNGVLFSSVWFQVFLLWFV